MEIVPGIHQIKLPAPVPGSQLVEVNAYLVKGDGEWMLIDTGWNTRYTFSSLQKQLAELGIGVEHIGLVLITHFHPDHYGLVGKLKESTQARVAMHGVEKDFIEPRYVDMEDLLDETSASLTASGVPADEVSRLRNASLEVRQYVSPFSPDIVLQGGETIPWGPFEFQVVWTPGHSPGHVCLYEPRLRVLLSGDHLLPTIFSNVGLHAQSGPDPLGDYMRSLEVCECLDVQLALPAHEYPFTLVKERIGQVRKHHQERRTAIIDTLRDTPNTAYGVSCSIPWLVNGTIYSFTELAAIDKRLALMSALAHLEPLCKAGVLKQRPRDGVVAYSLADSK